MARNPYEVLEIHYTASNDEVKKAYRAASRKWHPDSNLDNQEFAEEKFKEVQEAYREITEARERGDYSDLNRNSTGGYGNPFGGGYGNPYGSSPFGSNPYGRSNSGYGGNTYGTGGYGGNSYGGSYGGSSYGNSYNGPKTDPFGTPYDDPFGSYGAGGTRYDWSGGSFGQNMFKPWAEIWDSDNAAIKAAANYINDALYADAINILAGVPNKDGRWFYMSALANWGSGNTITAIQHIDIALQYEPGNSTYMTAKNQITGNTRRYDEVRRAYTVQTPSSDCFTRACLTYMICGCCC